MFKKILLLVMLVSLNACQTLKEKKPKSTKTPKDIVMELSYDEKQKKLVLQKANDLESKNIINISEKSFPTTTDTRIKNNHNVVVNNVDDEDKAIVFSDFVESVSDTAIIQPSKIKQPKIKISTNINVIKKAIPAFNLEGPESVATGIDIVFDKNKLAVKKIKQKNILGSGSNVVFEEIEEILPITKLPIAITNGEEQLILENQLNKQYKKELEAKQYILQKNDFTNKISRNIFNKFSQEINQDISRLEDIKNSYQDTNTTYIKKNDNDNALDLLQKTYYTHQTPDITDISLESIKSVIAKAKNNSSNSNYLNELLKLQSTNIKPKEKIKTQPSLLTLDLSSIQKVIKEKEDALKNNTKMWQNIDRKSNKLVQKKIKNNKLLKKRLEILKKRLNSSGLMEMSKIELHNIIEQLNQLDKEFNNPNKLSNKQVSQNDINKLLKKLNKLNIKKN